MIAAIIDIYFGLVPALFFILYWKESKTDAGIRFIVAYAIIIFIINFTMLNWGKIPILYDSYTLIEFLFFCAFLHVQLSSKTSKKLLLFFCLFFTAFYVFWLLYTQKVGEISSIPQNQVVIDSIPIGIEAIIILCFSFYYLYERMADTTTLFIYNTYQFWVVLGMVLYLAGSFFIYIFSAYLSPVEVKKYWVVTNYFSILKSIFFIIAIVYHARPTKNQLTTDFEVSYLN